MDWAKVNRNPERWDKQTVRHQNTTIKTDKSLALSQLSLQRWATKVLKISEED